MEEKQVDQKKRWDWLPAHMPKVAQLMAERREQHGAAWVAECWKRSMQGEPGFLWAAEGPIAIGTPVDGDLVLKHYAIAAKFPGTATLVLADPVPTGAA
jgi:hypothetical protein